MHRLTFIMPSCLMHRFTMPRTTPKASRYTDWPSLFLSAWINICLLSLFYFVTGQYLRSPCYIKLQCLKDANLLLERSAASLWMNLWQEMQLKASYLSFSVRSSLFREHPPAAWFVSPPSTCLAWVQLSARLGLEMTSQTLLTSEWLRHCH